MGDYESQYEEYKKTLLKSCSFKDKLREKYNNTISAEKNYINTNGVLDKTIGLSLACGFCYALALGLVNLNNFLGILIRATLAIVGTVCFFRALHIGSEFKDNFGKANFRSYKYPKYIEDRVHSDKELECRNLVRELLARQIKMEEFQKRYEDLSRYDRYMEDLVDDYSFNNEIFKKL